MEGQHIWLEGESHWATARINELTLLPLELAVSSGASLLL